jgi:hypothetical protein
MGVLHNGVTSSEPRPVRAPKQSSPAHILQRPGARPRSKPEMVTPMERAPTGVSLLLAGLLGLWAYPSYADDPCAAFKWNVTHERTLFAGTPESVAAGGDGASAPKLLPDHLYGLTLSPQDRITLSVPLGKKAQFDGAFGGVARLHVPTAGTYRIALDQSGWIDVVGEHGVIPSSDFAGGSACRAPHKLVQFELPAGELLLQLSGVGNAAVKLTVTLVSDH